MAGFANNRYYNDPALGAAFANLAQAFAPPSAQDMAAFATAQKTRDEAARLAQLFAAGATPSEQAALIGVQTYGATPQGFTYKVDQDNATQRYGYDTQATTSAANNAADNARAMDEARLRDATQRYGYDTQASTQRYGYDSQLAGTQYTADQNRVADMFGDAYGPLNPGQVRPAVPQAEAAMFGLPGGLGAAQGAPKPPSMDEVKAADYLRLPQTQRDAIVFGSTPIEQVLDPTTSLPKNVTAPEALGQRPFVQQGSQAAMKQVWLRDPVTSRMMRGVFDPNTGKTLLEDGTPAPAGALAYDVPSTVGTPDQTGVGTPVRNAIDQQLIDISVAKNTAVNLRDLIAKAPASQGAVGWLRGTAQNVIQTGGEIGSYFGGSVKEVADAIASGAADAELAGNFDPNIPAIEMMANLLAFQYAKTTTGERLSNEMLRAAKTALGLDGLTANQRDSLARLDTAVKLIEQQEQILVATKQNGLRGPGAPTPTASVSPAPMPSGGAGVSPEALLKGAADLLPGGGTAPPSVGPPMPPVEPGTVVNGYRYRGGPLNDRNSWEPAQ